MATPSDEIDPKNDPKRKAKSSDPGWKFGFWPDINNKNMVECILCGKRCNGGIKRLKEHLVGGFKNTMKCPKTSTVIAQEMVAHMEKNRKTKPQLDDFDKDDDENEVEGPDGQQTVGSVTQSSRVSESNSKKRKSVDKSQSRGPMDNLLRRTPEQVVDERKSKKPSQTTIENRFRTPEERERACMHIAKWWYESGIPFNAAKRRSFEVMVESIGQYGPGLKPPSYHELRVPFLQKAKKEIDKTKQDYEKYWKTYGCTLMSDGWTDKRGRHIINFLVNCPEGTYFLGSIDASRHIQDKQLMYELLDEKIHELGPENVVQVVTDNASTYVAAGKMLEAKYPTLFWTPCAAHCIDLMLEDIGKLSKYVGVISKGRQVTTFIYRHTRLLEAMREKTSGKDLVKHGITRFATSFLTLQSLYKNREHLRELFSSDYWRTCKLAKTVAGKQVADVIFSISFWNGVEEALKACQPLLVVLRLVDGDELPACPEIVVAMDKAKESIMGNFDNNEKLYKPVIDIVERRWEDQMGQKLYMAALFLNPNKYFEYSKLHPNDVWKVNEAFQDVLDKMVPDQATNDKILSQSLLYKGAREGFAKEQSIRQRDKMNPIDWWSMYGGSSKELSNLAIRVLGLCCSASGCERCWSTFEFIHTKRRNRLEHQRLNDLVYIQYNERLATRFRERREKNRNFDPLVLDELNWSSEWMVDGGESDDLVHPNDNSLSWLDVDIATGASASLQGRNLPRTTRASTSQSNPTQQYSRRRRTVVSLDDEDDDQPDMRTPIEIQDFEADLETAFPNDDDDVEDDFGLPPEGDDDPSSRGPLQKGLPSFVDDFDD